MGTAQSPYCAQPPLRPKHPQATQLPLPAQARRHAQQAQLQFHLHPLRHVQNREHHPRVAVIVISRGAVTPLGTATAQAVAPVTSPAALRVTRGEP